MSDTEDLGELSPETKAFLARHQATGEPSKEQLERGLQRLTAPAVLQEAKVLPLRRKRPLLPPEALAAAAVVTILLGAQAAYLLFRKPVEPAVVTTPSAATELEAISSAWSAGNYAEVKRLASRECASDQCRPLANELTLMLERAEHPERLTPEEKEELLRFDSKLSQGKGTALARLLSATPLASVPEQLARGEQLFKQASEEKKAKNFAQAVALLDECVKTAPAYYSCTRLLGSVYASIATRDQSAAAMEKARQMYELFLELAPPDDEYVPKVRTILDAAPREAAPEPRVSVLSGQMKVLEFAGITRVAIGDPSVADVKTVGSDQVAITGVSAGKTTLLVWTSDGQRHAAVIEVDGSPDTPSAPQVDAREGPGEAVPDEPTLELQVGGSHLISFEKPLARVAIGDPQIADVEVVGQKLRVKGVNPGKTTLLMWLDGGERESMLVSVAADAGSVAKLFRQADDARAAGDWPRAVELAREVVAAEPGHAGARAVLEAARMEAREAYFRGYQAKDSSAEEAQRFFRYVMALTPPEDELHQKAKIRLAELAP